MSVHLSRPRRELNGSPKCLRVYTGLQPPQHWAGRERLSPHPYDSERPQVTSPNTPGSQKEKEEKALPILKPQSQSLVTPRPQDPQGLWQTALLLATQNSSGQGVHRDLTATSYPHPKQRAQWCPPSMRTEGDTGRPRVCRTLDLDRRSTPNARSLPSKIITRTNAYVTVPPRQARRATAYPLLFGHPQLSLMRPGCSNDCCPSKAEWWSCVQFLPQPP